MRPIGWAYSSAGEHYVDIVGVTGSIPVTPTIQLQADQGLSGNAEPFFRAALRSPDVALVLFEVSGGSGSERGL